VDIYYRFAWKPILIFKFSAIVSCFAHSKKNQKTEIDNQCITD